MTSRRLQSPAHSSAALESSNVISSISDLEGSLLLQSDAFSAQRDEASPPLQSLRLRSRHQSLSLGGEEDEEDFMSPRDMSNGREEFVSPFVASGQRMERDTASAQSSSRRAVSTRSVSQTSALSPGDLVTQNLELQNELRQKTEEVADLKTKIDNIYFSFQRERNSLTRDLEEAKSKASEFQRKAAALEASNRHLERELQRQEQHLFFSAATAQNLQVQISDLEREKVQLTAEVESQRQFAGETKVKSEELTDKLRAEKAQLQKDLEEVRRKEQRHSRLHQMQRITKIETELRQLRSRLDRQKVAYQTENSSREVSRSYSNTPKRKPPAKGPSSRCSSPKSPSFATQKKLLRDLTDFLAVSSPCELVPEVKRLTAAANASKRSEEFLRHMQQLVFDSSPPGSFETEPTLRQMWRWVKRLLGEYFRLLPTSETMNEISSMLNIAPGEEKETLQEMLDELSQFRQIRSQASNLLSSNCSQSTHTVLAELRELFALA